MINRDISYSAQPADGPTSDSSVAVLGTGPMGCALAKALRESGYQVVVGSRTPEKLDEIYGCPVVSFVEAAVYETVIFAIPAPAVLETASALSHLLNKDGKILLDVSNGNNSSAATNLANTCTAASVAKGFNTMSAYDLANRDADGTLGRMVTCCGDAFACDQVSEMSKRMGFTCRYAGSIYASGELEAKVMAVFPRWRTALLYQTLPLACFVFPYSIIRYNHCKGYAWYHLALQVMNKAFCWMSLNLLAIVFAAGIVASFYQLVRRDTTKPFPRPLAAWIDTRKQTGLIAMGFAFMHVLMSLLLFNPSYYAKFFDKNGKKMSDIGEISMLLGIIGFSLLTVTAIASFPGVRVSLGWSEWILIQRGAGFASLIFATFHVIIMGYKGWTGEKNHLNWQQTYCGMPPITLMSTLIPMAVMFFKLVAIAFTKPLDKIKAERGQYNAGKVQQQKV